LGKKSKEPIADALPPTPGEIVLIRLNDSPLGTFGVYEQHHHRYENQSKADGIHILSRLPSTVALTHVLLLNRGGSARDVNSRVERLPLQRVSGRPASAKPW
jgi:hypothetical protein